jgi:hypothetical protein
MQLIASKIDNLCNSFSLSAASLRAPLEAALDPGFRRDDGVDGFSPNGIYVP